MPGPYCQLEVKAFADLGTIARAAKALPDRRERIATALLAGMLSDSEFGAGPEEAADIALDYTQSLIEELDK